MDGALWIYFVLALGTVPPLVPNSAAIASAGALAAAGELDLALVLAVVAGSALAGDALIYAAGRLARGRTLAWLTRSSRRRAAVDWTAARIHAHGVPFVIAVRFVPSGRLVGGLTAALVRYPAPRFLLGAGTAEAIWASYSVGIGYWGGTALQNTWSATAIGTGFSVLVAGVAHLLTRRTRRRSGRTRGPVSVHLPTQDPGNRAGCAPRP